MNSVTQADHLQKNHYYLKIGQSEGQSGRIKDHMSGL